MPACGLLGGTIAGLLFGLLMGRLLYRQFQATRNLMGDASPEVFRAAARSSRRGTVPEDPAARDAALRLARHQLGELRRRRTVTYVVLVCILALEIWQSVTRSQWFWVAVAFFVVVLVSTVVMPGRLERRIERLEAGRPV